MLAHYKSAYQQYLTLLDETEKLRSELDIYKSATSIIEVRNQSLTHCLEREKCALEIEKKYRLLAEQSSKDGRSGVQLPCMQCTKLKEELQMLRSRCSHNSEKMLSWERIQDQAVEDLKKKVNSLTNKLVEFRRKSMIKEDLFWKDEVIADLRQQLGKQPPAPIKERTPFSAEREGRLDPSSSVVNIDPFSFNEPGDKTRQYLLTDPYIRKLAVAHPNHVFMDEHRNHERQTQPASYQQHGRLPQQSMEDDYVKTSFHVEEVNKLMFKSLRAESEISDLIDENKRLDARCSDLESKLIETKKQFDALKSKLAQRPIPEVTLQPGECQDGFEAFFTLVDVGDCECLDENTMYDAFFGRLSDEERLRYLDWMCGSCLLQSGIPRQRDPDARAGKKAFRACLFGIGGVFKRSYNGRRNVWINLRMRVEDGGNETKRPKFAHTQPTAEAAST